MSATDWRAGGADRWRRRQSKQGKHLRKPGKASGRRGAQTARMSVSVRELPAYHVASMRYVGPYGPHGIPELWVKLKTWMRTHGLLTPGAITLGVSYDDPSITAPERCRYDACVVVPPSLPPDRWVHRIDVAGGTCAVAVFEGTAHGIEAAWDRLFGAWLPASGFQPDDRPCVEIYRHPGGVANLPRFRCELCLPVRPL
jgi:AraC family transcriptional regulator